MATVVERYRPMRAVLKSDGVRSDLERRAGAVKAAADSMLAEPTDAWPRGIIADSGVGAGRAGATVIGVWFDVEIAHRILGSAIDAAG
jgi:hypothetical protein